MDWPLLLNALALCAIGILNVYSARGSTAFPEPRS